MGVKKILVRLFMVMLQGAALGWLCMVYPALGWAVVVVWLLDSILFLCMPSPGRYEWRHDFWLIGDGLRAWRHLKGRRS